MYYTKQYSITMERTRSVVRNRIFILFTIRIDIRKNFRTLVLKHI